MNKSGQTISSDAWINNKPKIFNVLFKVEDEKRIKSILKNYSKNYRECIRYDERGVEYLAEDRNVKRGFLDVLRYYMRLLWK